jgi:hypothetical protein
MSYRPRRRQPAHLRLEAARNHAGTLRRRRILWLLWLVLLLLLVLLRSLVPAHLAWRMRRGLARLPWYLARLCPAHDECTDCAKPLDLVVLRRGAEEQGSLRRHDLEGMSAAVGALVVVAKSLRRRCYGRRGWLAMGICWKVVFKGVEDVVEWELTVGLGVLE